MKTKNLFSLLLLTAPIFFAACIKDKSSKSNDDTEIETTFTLSGNQATSEAFQDDVNSIFYQASADNGLAYGRTDGASNTLGCATVSVTPANSFPKTITIDYGAGCTGTDGIQRKGIINIVLSDYFLKTGTTAVITFSNYYVAGYKLEGKINWANTTSNGFSWTRSIENGKITSPSGDYYWLHTGTTAVQQTAGANTPFDLSDDIYSITGTHTVTNPSGNSRTATITEALEKKVLCYNVSKGKIKIQGLNHFAIIDYGNGDCDKTATISIDGRPERTFLLP